jgi:hypothetical protein
MPAEKSDFALENNDSADQIPPAEISLEELESVHGGSALDHLQQLKNFKTKPGAYARLEISLMTNSITKDEYNLLHAGVKEDPYWR